MALSDQEIEIISRLSAHIRRDSLYLHRLGRYYDGEQVIEQLGLAIPPELRHLTVCVNWPRVTADSLEERIDMLGFRAPDTELRDEELARVWQANGLDEESQLAHLDAVVYGRSFVCVGANEDDETTPLVTVESPLEMTVDISPRTRRVQAALRHYKDRDVTTGLSTDRVTLYLPDVTIWASRRWSGPSRAWSEDDRDEHGLGYVPVVPIINRGRTKQRLGVSELEDVIGLTDAAARALTLAQLATETLSVPQRAVLGASENDFLDADGNVVPKWEAYFGAIWALDNENAKVQQFAAADLANFKTILDTYASHVSSVTGLPLRFFGMNTHNPPSADAIRADEFRLVKRAERRQRAWGGSWKSVARLIRVFQDGSTWADTPLDIEPIWRDAATPTLAQQADATVKLVQAGILPVEAGWEEMGYSPTKIAKLKAMRDEQIAATDVLARSVAAFQTPPAPADHTAPPAPPQAKPPAPPAA